MQSDINNPLVVATKHNPHCDCGICAYCNGQEDIYGNRSQKIPLSEAEAYPVFRINERDALLARVTRLEQALRSSSKAMLSAILEIEWLHERAMITTGNHNCDALRMLRRSVDNIVALNDEEANDALG